MRQFFPKPVFLSLSSTRNTYLINSKSRASKSIQFSLQNLSVCRIPHSKAPVCNSFSYLSMVLRHRSLLILMETHSILYTILTLAPCIPAWAPHGYHECRSEYLRHSISFLWWCSISSTDHHRSSVHCIHHLVYLIDSAKEMMLPVISTMHFMETYA